MSPSLRAEVMFYTAALQISHHRIFKRCSPDFTATLAMHMQPEFFAPREKLISPKDYPTKMHFIRRGVVGCQGRVYTIGGYIGKDMLFDLFLDLMNGMRRSYSAVALTYVESLCLNQSALPTILQEYPFATGTMRAQVFKEVLRMEVLAYTNAHRRIRNHESSAHVMLRGDPLGREAFHFSKLSLIYDADLEQMSQLEKHAIVLQRSFRRFLVRRELEEQPPGPMPFSKRKFSADSESRSSFFSGQMSKKHFFASRVATVSSIRSGLEAVMNVMRGSVDSTAGRDSSRVSEKENENYENLLSSTFVPSPSFTMGKLKSPLNLMSKSSSRKLSTSTQPVKKRYSIGKWEEGGARRVPAPFRNKDSPSSSFKSSRMTIGRLKTKSMTESSRETNISGKHALQVSRNKTQEIKSREWNNAYDHLANATKAEEKIGKFLEAYIEVNVSQVMEKAMTKWINNNMKKMLE
eukprot:CAMPEP_0196589328 /NCGR_PEP_ID=MMETSP1081-20130531/63261_1 /TAXON_ID=36882 /ORGANISM="Pyramimonas amylifera, Strain CCMP720" /LENGTH=463 /DNA_ID=CAMNT_0041912095 /DNA_START=75 /DNA_END=1466 /DNA_ORIENTATION=+